jgi:hypothetical protein
MGSFRVIDSSLTTKQTKEGDHYSAEVFAATHREPINLIHFRKGKKY